MERDWGVETCAATGSGPFCMIDGKRVLCVVAARGGSTGLPGKNIRPLNGRPLIAWSILQARAVPEIDRIVVSTDCDDIANAAMAAGAEAPFRRPAELATSEAGKFAVWKHALAASEEHFGEEYGVFVDLDCTGPVRDPEDISAICRQLVAGLDRRLDAVMTVTEARRNPYFNLLEAGEDGGLRPSKAAAAEVLARQRAPRCFDAVASIYALRADFVRQGAGLFAGRVEGYEVGAEKGFDVDDELDFQIIEMIMTNRETGHA